MRLKKASASNSVHLDHHIWPIERDIMFRPARMKYLRKLIKSDECVFCLSAKKPLSLKSLCVYKSKHSQIVLNKYPYNSGHILILPLHHKGDIFELSDEVYADLQKTLKLAMTAVQEIYQPSGFNLGMNHGATAGAGIPDHVHYHVVPRWHGDLNFFPLIAETKLTIETLAQSYKRYENYFKQNVNNNLKKTSSRKMNKRTP